MDSPRPNEAAPAGEVATFVRFCYHRRRAGWPELYDEMCAVAARRLYNGWGFAELADHGIGFSLYETPALASLAREIVREETERRIRNVHAASSPPPVEVTATTASPSAVSLGAGSPSSASSAAPAGASSAPPDSASPGSASPGSASPGLASPEAASVSAPQSIERDIATEDRRLEVPGRQEAPARSGVPGRQEVPARPSFRLAGATAG